MDHKIEAAAQLAHQLSEGQKIVLRRVHALQQSKEIARELGISKEAVDKRVEAAMQRLGVTSRREAAMALSLSEQNCLYDRIISDPVELSTTPSNGASGLPHATGQRFTPPVLEEAQAAYGRVFSARHQVDVARHSGGFNHELGAFRKLALGLIASVGLILAVGIFLSGMDSLSRVAISLSDTH